MDKLLINSLSNYFGKAPVNKAPVYKPLKIKKPETPLQKALDKLANMK